MYASSWLGYSWEFVDIADSRLDPLGASASDVCRVQVGIVSRRERFRLDAGPSREELQRLHILSILRKIRSPSFLPPEAGVNEQQLEKKVFVPLVRDTCASARCGQASDTRASLEFTSLEAVSCVATHCSVAKNGAVPHMPGLDTTLFSPSSSSSDSNGDHQHGSSVSLDFSDLSEVKLNELLQSVSWPLSAVGDMGSMDPFDISWDNVPESADPMRGSGYKAGSTGLKGEERKIRKNDREDEEDDPGHGDCSMGRGERKRLQVENIASALSAFQLKAGSRIIDFGCGSGALTLPLAALFPELSFVGVDFKQQSIALLEQRARKANLRNVAAFHGRIENFSEPFDACVALHACGIATDLALLQAMKHRAAYVMSPCCIGKLQIPIQQVMLNSAQHMQSQKKLCSVSPSAATDRISANMDSPGKDFTFHFGSLESNEVALEGLNPNLMNGTENALALDEACRSIERSVLKDSRENLSFRLAYPRSRWLRTNISENDFQVLARAADWSSYDHESSLSRLHCLCKVVLELDRNEASRELGYWTGLFSLSNEKAGTVGVSHVLVGKPPHLFMVS